jgi:hypothetical protein
MKTYEERIAELKNVVIQLVWTYTVFSEYWKKSKGYRAARMTHPEFSLVLHNSLLCDFFISTRILFKGGGNDESLSNLIAHFERTNRKPALSERLRLKRLALEKTLEKLRDLRDDLFAHRFQDKKAEEVSKKLMPRLGQMKEVADLAKEILYELLDKKQREFLDGQQLSHSTLQSIAADTRTVLDAFSLEE